MYGIYHTYTRHIPKIGVPDVVGLGSSSLSLFSCRCGAAARGTRILRPACNLKACTALQCNLPVNLKPRPGPEVTLTVTVTVTVASSS